MMRTTHDLMEKQRKARRARERARAATPATKVFMRKGGWNPKIRQRPDADLQYQKWRHDPTKSPWWSLFNNQETFQERSYQCQKFYHLAGVLLVFFRLFCRRRRAVDSPPAAEA